MRLSLSLLPCWLTLSAGSLLPFLAAAQTTAPTVLYVNDAATSGDVFTSAAGNDATGTGSAAAPFATVARALTEAGPATQTIFIDAGTYAERVVLTKAVSLRGAGTASAQPASATVFAGGLLPAGTQTAETGLFIAVSGGTSSQWLTIGGLTIQGYDFGIQASNPATQAYVLLQDVETVHNRRQGIFWNSLNGVHHLTLRRVRATYTAEGANSTANGAGRGVFLVNGSKADILIEDGVFELNRRGGVDVNDGSVSNLTVRNCQFAQNAGGALVVLGAAGARDASGNYTSPAALLEGNTIRNNGSNGMELKACTGTGLGSGPGSFVVRQNTIFRTIGAPTSLTEDNAGIAFIDRDRNVITAGGGLTGDLVTGGAFVQGNTIRGYLSDANSSSYQINGFGVVLEGANNKAFGNVVAQCQLGIQVQDRPANSTGYTPFFDSSRNGLVVSAGDSLRGNRLDSCAYAIRAVNLTNPVDASLNWLGASAATAVRGATGLGGLVATLGGPTVSFAAVSALAPTGQIDYSPFANSRNDATPAAGFQPLLDYLNVDAGSPRSAATAPLGEGLALVAEGGTLRLAAGSYDEGISVAKDLTLTATGAATLRDLTLDGPGKTLTLGAPLTISGSLTLTNGLVQTTAANLLTLADQATATSGSATSYVDGPLRKIGQQAFVFPLGKNGQWARLGISAPASATTAFTAEYVAAAPATHPATAPLSEVSQVEHWTLDGAGTTNAVSVRLFWEDAFRSGIDDFSPDLQVATFAGAQWQTTGNGGLGGSLGTGSVVSAQPVSSFGDFTLGSLSPAANPLTRQLGSFTATQPRPSVVDVHWTLSDETNTYGYVVERSADAAAWQPLGFVPSQGVGAQARTYTYQDVTLPSLPQVFYRLRQNTTTGAARYSPVAAVALAASPLATVAATTASFMVFPNPASGQVTLQLPVAVGSPVRVLLTDLSGRPVLRQTVRNSSATTLLLPTSLTTGIYLLQVQGAGLDGKPQRLMIQ